MASLNVTEAQVADLLAVCGDTGPTLAHLDQCYTRTIDTQLILTTTKLGFVRAWADAQKRQLAVPAIPADGTNPEALRVTQREAIATADRFVASAQGMVERIQTVLGKAATSLGGYIRDEAEAAAILAEAPDDPGRIAAYAAWRAEVDPIYKTFWDGLVQLAVAVLGLDQAVTQAVEVAKQDISSTYESARNALAGWIETLRAWQSFDDEQKGLLAKAWSGLFGGLFSGLGTKIVQVAILAAIVVGGFFVIPPAYRWVRRRSEAKKQQRSETDLRPIGYTAFPNAARIASYRRR